MFLYKTQSSAKRRTDDLILFGRSLMDPCRPRLDLRLGHLTPLFDSAQRYGVSFCYKMQQDHTLKEKNKKVEKKNVTSALSEICSLFGHYM